MYSLTEHFKHYWFTRKIEGIKQLITFRLKFWRNQQFKDEIKLETPILVVRLHF